MKYAGWKRGGRVRSLALPTWQIALVLALALALGVAVAVVATGVFLVGFPIAVLAALAYRIFGGARRRRPTRRHGEGIIEGEYEVLDRERWDPHRGESGRSPR